MLFTNKQTYLIMQLLLVLMLGICILSSCQKDIVKTNSGNQNSSNEIRSIQEYYYPLTAEKFNAIINNTDHISGIVIYYSFSGALLSFAVNSPNRDNQFSDINNYQGELLKKSGSPLQSNAFSHDFSVSEIQDIIDYLSQNSAYFFNGEEFEGKYPPRVLAISIFKPVCSGKYAFSLQITKPNQSEEEWTIQKCVDEYPAEGTPLYGLFQMLENDFITQFEE